LKRRSLKPRPHWRLRRRNPRKIVAENGDKLSPFTATVYHRELRPVWTRLQVWLVQRAGNGNIVVAVYGDNFSPFRATIVAGNVASVDEALGFFEKRRPSNNNKYNIEQRLQEQHDE